MNSTSKKFQSLLNDRQHRFPTESYEHCFTAVTNSDEGKSVLSQMHRAGDSLANSVPVQSPRHAALLGRIWPIPAAEFSRLWTEKYGATSAGSPLVDYPDESEERAAPPKRPVVVSREMPPSKTTAVARFSPRWPDSWGKDSHGMTLGESPALLLPEKRLIFNGRAATIR
jgi:hypothetical protein